MSNNADMCNVWAVVGNRPLEKQNERPIPRPKAEALAQRLEKGKTAATRVLVTKA